MPTKTETETPPAEPINDPTANTRAAIAVFDEEFQKLNLFGKIARISGFLGAVPKRGFNAFHKYHYVTEGDLVGAVRQYLAAANIVMIPDVTDVIKDGELTTVLVEYTVTDGNEAFTFKSPGTGSDRGDKGLYKAMTGSQKYAIMKLFKIETGDDPESDTRVDERAAQADKPATRPTVTRGERGTIGRGAHTANASPIQIRRISELMKDLDLDRPALAAMIQGLTGVEIVLPDNDDEQGKLILAALRGLTTEQAGDIVAQLADRVNERTDTALAGGAGDYS